jgi:hypothetical protein
MTNENESTLTANDSNTNSTTNLTTPKKKWNKKSEEANVGDDSNNDEYAADDEDTLKENNPLNPKNANSSDSKEKERVLIVSLNNTPERESWNKKVEFLLAVIGFAVDLGNVWR